MVFSGKKKRKKKKKKKKIKFLFFNIFKEEEGEVIKREEKEKIKGILIDLMLKSPIPIQRQFREAVSIIGSSDFPKQWESLLPVSK